MRLLQVATIHETIRAFLLPIARHFRGSGWRVDAMARGVTGCAECREAFDRVFDADWSRNPLAPRNLFRRAGEVRKVVEDGAYDIVHVHTPVGAYVTRMALRNNHGKPGSPKVVYTVHGFHFHRGGHPLRNAVFLLLEKLAGRWTDYLVVINHQDEAAAKRYRIVAPERVRYMPGIGVDTARWSPEAVPPEEVARVRAELNLQPGDRLLLMVAEFIPRKRHRDALHAFARLERNDVHLAFAGTGPLLEESKRLAAESGLDGRVHFLGFRRDVAALMRSSAAVLLPSEREGLPRSLLEALSLEAPAIGSQIRGTRGLMSDGSGVLVPVGDVAALSEAMRRLLDHPEEAEAMAKQGRRRILESYSRKHILELHDALYREALSP